MTKRLVSLLLTVLLFVSTTPAFAQNPTPPPGPVYVVQQGDTLWGIAARFNVSVADLQAANGLVTGDIYPGDRLVIPGLQDVTGVLISRTVAYGETLRLFIRQYRLDETILHKLNHLTSPTELYAGANLILPQQEGQAELTARTSLGTGETLLELAVRSGTDPWTVASLNGLSGTWDGLPGDVLYLPGGDSTAAPTGLPASILSAVVDPLPASQGDTVQIKITTGQPVTLGGQLGDYALQFFPLEGNVQVALQGVHAMTEPGLYPLRLDVTLPDGSTQSFEQMILVASANFKQDPVLIVGEETIDPAVTGPENELLLSYTTVVNPEKYWDGVFLLPVDAQYCLRSFYGNRRSYNNSEYIYFHTGVDFGICSEAHPFDIYSPAAGIVAFSGPLTVRGNATIIDHGHGVYTGIWHQEEMYVAVGDRVAAGQLIGKIGDTGRVTGPHLHWEMWVNGVQVEPMQWLTETFPH
jgi:murein DD-endopeptidase MepM/ murein hydrolase activator NlpD